MKCTVLPSILHITCCSILTSPQAGIGTVNVVVVIVLLPSSFFLLLLLQIVSHCVDWADLKLVG